MQMSENINELATALAKAQGEMKNAGKTSDNPFFKSKYADLAEILNAVREPLSKYGLSISQLYDGMGMPDKTITVTTLLMHSSGQYISNSANYPVAKADIQGVGSAITYARRYSLAAILGLSQEDDDGNAAVGNVRFFESSNNIVHMESCKRVVIQGIHDCILSEKNGQILICHRSEEQRIKEFSAE